MQLQCSVVWDCSSLLLANTGELESNTELTDIRNRAFREKKSWSVFDPGGKAERPYSTAPHIHDDTGRIKKPMHFGPVPLEKLF